MCIYTEQGGVLNSFCSLADYLEIYKYEKVCCMFVHLGKVYDKAWNAVIWAIMGFKVDCWM